MSSGPTASIAQWVVDLPLTRTAKDFDLAVAGLRDVIGCMLGGSGQEEARLAAETAYKLGGSGATIIGKAEPVNAAAAALANATAAHTLDYDDSFEPLTGHPSCSLCASLLALAEVRGKNGADLLDAYIVGIQVLATLGDAFNPSHVMKGWHATATLGVIGSAAACARLLGLDRQKIIAAISIAVSLSAGSCRQIGTAVKPIHAGFAAHNAVMAVMLAESGIEGNLEPLVGDGSFAKLYTDADPALEDFKLPTGTKALAIRYPGITYKPYPTCGSTHRTIAGLLDLRERHGFLADDIDAVEITVPQLNVDNLRFPEPTSGREARFSMNYCAALAILYGEIQLSDFEDEAVGRPEVQQLMKRITMMPQPGSQDKQYMEVAAHTLVVLKGGREFEDQRLYRNGSILAPMSEEEHKAKFMNCVGRRLPDDGCEKVHRMIMNLSTLADIGGLMTAMREL